MIKIKNMVKKILNKKLEMRLYAGVGFIVVLTAIILVNLITEPTFYDWFGLVVFTFLFFIGYFILFEKKTLPDWAGFIIFLIGILGLIVDGTIIIKTYFS